MDDSLAMKLRPARRIRSRILAGVLARTRKAGPAAMALVIGLAALTAQATESDLVRDIQRYCTVCWRNARLDPTLWDDCTQEVCCRLLTKARDGQLDLNQVLAEDTPERRELVRAIDMVRKRVQRTKRHQPIDSLAIASARRGPAKPRATGARRDPRGRATCRPLAPSGSDPRALDARLARPRDRRRAEHAGEPGQRREVQGLAQARASSSQSMRRAGNRPGIGCGHPRRETA